MTRRKFKKAPQNVNVSAISKVIAVSACLLASSQVMAQAGFDFGVKGNIQGSTLINLPDQAAGPELDFVNKIHVAGGISGGYDFNKHIGVELNVLYSRQGQDYKGDISQISPANKGYFSNNIELLANANNITLGDPYNATVALTYIKIPLLFRYTGNNTKSVFFSSFLGPQLDLLSSVKYTINGANASLSKLGMSSTASYNKTSVDGVLGLGAGFNLSQHLVLSAHVRLDYGLGDAENKSATYTFDGTGKFYDTKRATTNNATAGVLFSLDYKLPKKAKAKEIVEENNDDTNTTTTTEKTKAKTKHKDNSDDGDDKDNDDSNTDDKTQDKTKK